MFLTMGEMPESYFVQAIDAGDAVPDREDGAGLHHVDLLVVRRDLLLDDRRDFFGAELHWSYLV